MSLVFLCSQLLQFALAVMHFDYFKAPQGENKNTTTLLKSNSQSAHMRTLKIICKNIPSPTSACQVFSGFHNPRNSDMDYRIFNVRSVRDHFCACTYTRGLGTPTASQHFFFTWKNSLFLVLLIGLKLGSCVQ